MMDKVLVCDSVIRFSLFTIFRTYSIKRSQFSIGYIAFLLTNGKMILSFWLAWNLEGATFSLAGLEMLLSIEASVQKRLLFNWLALKMPLSYWLVEKMPLSYWLSEKMLLFILAVGEECCFLLVAGEDVAFLLAGEEDAAFLLAGARTKNLIHAVWQQNK